MSGTFTRGGEVHLVTNRELLFRVLPAVGVVAALVLAAPAVFAFVGGNTTTAIIGAACAVTCIGAGLLSLSLRASLNGLRGMEAAIFAALTGFLTANTLLASGSGGSTALATAVVLGAYGVMVPNSPGRAAAAIVVLALPPSIALLVSAGNSSSSELALVGLAALIAIAGAALIASFRKSAVDANTENMYGLRELIGQGGMGRLQNHVVGRARSFLILLQSKMAGMGTPQPKHHVSVHRLL